MAIPVLAGIFGVLTKKKGEIAADSGVAEEVVGRVLAGVERYASKDERVQAQIFMEMENARAHDVSTFDKTNVAANRLRSCVRPFVTFAAMGWYIYARVNEVDLSAEDYAIIGGILAFWFGFRPFEKGRV